MLSPATLVHVAETVIPSLELQYIHSFASTLIRLIGNRIGSKRKLELDELTLPWERLWKFLELEMWPKKRMAMIK